MKNQPPYVISLAGLALMAAWHFLIVRPPTHSVFMAQLILYGLMCIHLIRTGRKNPSKIANVFFLWTAVKIFFWAAFFLLYFYRGPAVRSAEAKTVLIDFALLYLTGLVFEVWTGIQVLRNRS